MSRVATLLTVLLAGCPDLPPLVRDIPIEGEPTCSARRERVACTIDGDTFDVGACGQDVGERVRLIGVDAPEIAHDGTPADCFGDEAADNTRRVLHGLEVTLSFDVECTDTFGRSLAYVWLDDPDDPEADPILLQDLLLSEGWVRLYEEFDSQDLKLASRLEAAEARARGRGLGLWSACASTD